MIRSWGVDVVGHSRRVAQDENIEVEADVGGSSEYCDATARKAAVSIGAWGTNLVGRLPLGQVITTLLSNTLATFITVTSGRATRFVSPCFAKLGTDMLVAQLISN